MKYVLRDLVWTVLLVAIAALAAPPFWWLYIYWVRVWFP